MSDSDTFADKLSSLAQPDREAALSLALAQAATPALSDAIRALVLRQEAASNSGTHSIDGAQPIGAAILAGVAELTRRASASVPYGPTSAHESGFQPEVYVHMNLFDGSSGTPEQPKELAIEKPASLLLHIATSAVRESGSRREQAVVALVFCAFWIEAYFNQLIELSIS